MTGYGRGQATVDGTDILVEIKSVNNRYYDFSARLPRMYGYLEEKLKTFLSGSISRGKIEVSVSIYNSGSKSEEISINLDVANGYINALREANESLGLTDDITLSHVSRFPEVFIVKKIIEDEESVWNNIKPVAEEAVAKFVAMREIEGEKMKEDLSSRLDFILSKVEEVEKLSPATTENYRNRLYQKLKDILSDNNIDEQRILTEAAIFSEKVAVDEETVRLRSHISQFRELHETNE
ncbi:MAG: YicC family protein, partial [Oscillospiraceae bacterium]|nr:YicC family protein [Oscillospiraceae bacterium]